ncbi:hypothetical protein F511_34619 [Dorcoceras hygrometricum]|uniref:Uncharacterized protein n=1 Tax=Dorcoceras hygrometricum TaxID=472368 RepID=A0A2Z7DDP2_9LAMI|nr:hypothetical protein F511_34619 [Dorcoceras hygrometricum]
MDNAGMVAMLESLVATGLKGFLGCPAVIHEAELLEFFANGSVRDGLVVSTVNGVSVEISEQLLAETFELPMEVLTDLLEIPKDLVFYAKSIISFYGEPVSISGKKKEMNIEFRLLCDIMVKTISVKAGSFDAFLWRTISVATNAQLFLDYHPHSSSTSTDSSLHFDDNEIRLEDEVASPHIPIPAVASNISETLAQIRASVDQIRFEQLRSKDDVDRLRDTLLMHIRDIEKKSTKRFDELDRIAAAAIDNVDVRREVKEIHAKIDDLDRQVATIRNEQLDFRVKAEENYLNMSTQLGDIVDFLRGGDAKKGQGSSSRPQPPPDNNSRPSGRTGGSGIGAQGHSRPGLGSGNRGSGSGISQSKGNRSGCSKRRSSVVSRLCVTCQHNSAAGYSRQKQEFQQLGTYFSSKYFQQLDTVILIQSLQPVVISQFAKREIFQALDILSAVGIISRWYNQPMV